MPVAGARLRSLGTIDRATGRWIGRIGLDELEDWPAADQVEVGFELHRGWWGRGLATESAIAALRFGFLGHRLEDHQRPGTWPRVG